MDAVGIANPGNSSLVGEFNPSGKILVNLDHFPNSDENKQTLKCLSCHHLVILSHDLQHKD